MCKAREGLADAVFHDLQPQQVIQFVESQFYPCPYNLGVITVHAHIHVIYHFPNWQFQIWFANKELTEHWQMGGQNNLYTAWYTNDITSVLMQ